MKKFIFILSFLFSLPLCARDFGDDRYSVSAYGVYGYNGTWKNFGGADIKGFMPVNFHYEMDASFEILSSGVFSASVTARPKFPLSVGELFVDGSLFYRNLYKYRASEFVSAVSVGYRMDYVSAQVGLFSRTMINNDRASQDNEAYVGEPFNLLYRVSFKVRPAFCVWNVGGGITDYNDFEYERMWEPLFFIDGHYDINDNLRLLAEVYVKPTGMFHLVASFYGITVKAGLSYRF